MGSAPFKERAARAAASGIFTGESCGADDWDDVIRIQEKLRSCRSINLSHNKFKKPVPRALVQMPCFTTTLRVLDLSRNNISNVDALAAGVPPIASVHDALAFATRFAEGSVTGVAQLALEKLNLSYNTITSLPLLFLVAMPKLKDLDVSFNALAAVGGDEDEANRWALIFAFGDSLKTLDLRGNKLTVIPLSVCGAVQPLRNLEAIDLSENLIQRAELRDHSTTLAQLRTMNLSSQKSPGLVSVDPALYAAGPKLVDVILDGNAAKTNILEALRKTEEYTSWVQRRASTVDRQLAGGADARLVD